MEVLKINACLLVIFVLISVTLAQSSDAVDASSSGTAGIPDLVEEAEADLDGAATAKRTVKRGIYGGYYGGLGHYGYGGYGYGYGYPYYISYHRPYYYGGYYGGYGHGYGHHYPWYGYGYGHY